MPIVSEAGRGRRGDSGSSGFGRRGRQRSGPAAGGGGSFSSSSSVVLGSDSRAAVLQCDEMEASDEEVQSSIRGPLDTLDVLQEALPKNRKRLPKFYNGKSSSVANAAEPAQDAANPGKPSPKKRKGFLSFSFSWNKSRSSKGSSSSSRRDADAATSSKNSSRKTPPPSPTTSSSQCNGRGGGGNGHARLWLHSRSSTTSRGASASPPPSTYLRSSSQRIAVQMQPVCLEDVEESTASLSTREKRRKSLR